ncbi:MAG: LysR substrate-binding domain-containing protein [Paracoccus sp. (in: a-proteobacteria)]|uniref:LysR substrate-binding domain-containing protein n=1 Tax=Paracoccus sp. TaxID=267 RepID=UPI002E8496ED|nr:LysR substrate-binding domain-containing protein [Pseudomonadota bacterium]
MNSTNFDLGECRAMLAVYAVCSFRLAAEQLGMSPSSLSRVITGLEVRIGARLFDRDTRNVIPTEEGRAFAALAERLVITAEGGAADFTAFLEARRGRLTIAGLPSVTAGLLPELLERFTRAHPAVDLRILDALSDSVVASVARGEADLGFTAGTVGTRDQLSFQALLDDQFVAVGPPGGQLSEDRAYTLVELMRMPFIAMARGTSVRELLDGACARIGQQVDPRFEVSHLATAGALVAQGLGVSALPRLTLPVLGSRDLLIRPIADFGASRRIGLVWRSGRTLSPPARAFLQLVRSAPLQAVT